LLVWLQKEKKWTIWKPKTFKYYGNECPLYVNVWFEAEETVNHQAVECSYSAVLPFLRDIA
jgi:hypothetical protein